MEPENPYAPPAAEVDATGTTPDTDLGQAEQLRLEHLRQEASVLAFGLLAVLTALFGGAWGVFLLKFGTSPNTGARLVVSLGAAVLGVILFGVGVGLLRLAPWSRVAGLLGAALALLLFPAGTLAGALLFQVLLSSKGRFVLSPEHARLRERTPHVKPWPLAIVIFFALLLIAAMASALLLSLYQT